MGEAKPWQIAVVVIGLLTLVGMVVWQCRQGTVELASSITLVDVESGQLIEAPLPKNRAVLFPATNPETKRKTLFPAHQTESGNWEVSSRYVPYVKSKEVDPKAVDLKTGSIANVSGPVRKDVF
jgi:hypothetical protein